MKALFMLVGAVLLCNGAHAQQSANDAGIDWVNLPGFEIARTETTVAQFRRFVRATGLRTAAEQAGGGQVYEAGWTRKPGWTWAAPFGADQPAADDEPAVHLSFHEAQAFCRWAGGRLPSDAQWLQAAYTEQRAAPPAPFRRGQTYPYPSGALPAGAQCLDDCGPGASARGTAPAQRLWRGPGHARAGSTPLGVNGLHEMGANAWEWVDEPAGAQGEAPRRTRGGSWWYGAQQMRAEHLQSKPADTAVVYIGFRCVRQPTEPPLPR
jgi:formylglycine-generating enzyme required for sulfatase activity